mmetsp:Transcript_143/g.521  ORF Transcript_143/g.521 Transcript_143/m.521 type:complete len:564 (-) Transcript_143:90-1781(-)
MTGNLRSRKLPSLPFPSARSQRVLSSTVACDGETVANSQPSPDPNTAGVPMSRDRFSSPFASGRLTLHKATPGLTSAPDTDTAAGGPSTRTRKQATRIHCLAPTGRDETVPDSQPSQEASTPSLHSPASPITNAFQRQCFNRGESVQAQRNHCLRGARHVAGKGIITIRGAASHAPRSGSCLAPQQQQHHAAGASGSPPPCLTEFKATKQDGIELDSVADSQPSFEPTELASPRGQAAQSNKLKTFPCAVPSEPLQHFREAVVASPGPLACSLAPVGHSDPAKSGATCSKGSCRADSSSPVAGAGPAGTQHSSLSASDANGILCLGASCRSCVNGDDVGVGSMAVTHQRRGLDARDASQVQLVQQPDSTIHDFVPDSQASSNTDGSNQQQPCVGVAYIHELPTQKPTEASGTRNFPWTRGSLLGALQPTAVVLPSKGGVPSARRLASNPQHQCSKGDHEAIASPHPACTAGPKRVHFAPGPLAGADYSSDGHPSEERRAAVARRDHHGFSTDGFTHSNIRIMEALLDSVCQPSIDRLKRRLKAVGDSSPRKRGRRSACGTQER